MVNSTNKYLTIFKEFKNNNIYLARNTIIRSIIMKCDIFKSGYRNKLVLR